MTMWNSIMIAINDIGTIIIDLVGFIRTFR